MLRRIRNQAISSKVRLLGSLKLFLYLVYTAHNEVSYSDYRAIDGLVHLDPTKLFPSLNLMKCRLLNAITVAQR